MPEHGFPLPGSSYKELVKIIQGYGAVPDHAVPADVSKVIGIHPTIVSRNNRFLVAVGIVQGGKKKSMTPLGSELAHALQYGLEDEIASKWRAILDATEFFQKVLAAVRIRKGMDESSLEAHVAYSAGQPKTPMVAAGASAVVDILKASRLLMEDAGNLVPGSVSLEPQETTQAPIPPPEDVPPPEPDVLSPRSLPAGHRTVQLTIEVRVQCTPKDLDGLGRKLRRVLADFNEPEPERHDASPANGANAAISEADDKTE